MILSIVFIKKNKKKSRSKVFTRLRPVSEVLLTADVSQVPFRCPSIEMNYLIYVLSIAFRDAFVKSFSTFFSNYFTVAL